MCVICTEIYNKNFKNIKCLNVSHCKVLTSEKLQEVLIQCKNLETLLCYNCTSLTSLDLRSNINLKTLWCDNCTSLISLDLRNNSEGVTSFGCINLATLGCNSCTSLTSLDLPKEYNGYIDCSNCPWITQNKDFSNNYQNLIKLQRWYRKLVIIKYMKSQEFIEWFYNPNNIGGKCHKKSLLNSF